MIISNPVQIDSFENFLVFWTKELQLDFTDFTAKQNKRFLFLAKEHYDIIEQILKDTPAATSTLEWQKINDTLIALNISVAYKQAKDMESKKDPPINIRQQIGQVWVDSGQVMIVDPCYLSSWDTSENDYSATYNDEEGPFKFSYNGACNATLSYKHAAQLEHGAVASSTAYGDGSYPVFATYGNDGRIMKLEILFDWDEEEDEEDYEEDYEEEEMPVLITPNEVNDGTLA